MKIKDQIGRFVELNYPPQRIISLVPSQTELLHYLGLEEQVVGITKFCVYPKHWHKIKTKVGGTKQYNLETIKSLQPDLIVANKEENDKEQIEMLSKNYPVWISDIKTLTDALDMIVSVGQLVNKKIPALDLAKILKIQFSALQFDTKPKVAYLIWRKPYMVAANDTFIHEMLTIAGYENVFSLASRYPQITLEELGKRQPDLIFLSSEPYPFKEKHFEEFKAHCPNAKVLLVDGELFSWYGSRLLNTPSYFMELRNKQEDITNS
jgi:ABC-type Fe3+-hydroxamate transport system substrate-binding protein